MLSPVIGRLRMAYEFALIIDSMKYVFFSFLLIDLLADCRSWVEANLTARYHKKRAAADFCFKYFHGLHLMQMKILKQYLRVSYKAQANDVHRAQIYSIWLCLFSNDHSLIKFR